MLELDNTAYASKDFGTVKITLAAGVAQGPDKPCRSCVIKPADTNTATVYLGAANPANANNFPLPQMDFPMPVTNLNKLFFYSTDVDAVVSIIWRS